MLDSTSTPSQASQYVARKPETIPLDKVYIIIGHTKVWLGRGGDIAPGGLVREHSDRYGPQRDPCEKTRLRWLRDRATNFKAHLFEEPTHLAADKDGNYEDLDGGGRAVIAAINGHLTIEAFVDHNLAPEQRATRFRDHQASRVSLGKVQDFLASVAEGDKGATAIVRALAPNYVVAKSGKGAINSVIALEKIANKAGIDVLRRTAQFAAAAWKPKTKTLKGGKKTTVKAGYHVPGNLFVALAAILEAAPANYDEAKLRTFLAAHSPEDINKAANDTIVKMATNVKKGNPAAVMRIMTQDMAGEMAKVIIRGYHSRLDPKYGSIEVDDVMNSALLKSYTGDRSGSRDTE